MNLLGPNDYDVKDINQPHPIIGRTGRDDRNLISVTTMLEVGIRALKSRLREFGVAS
jgi:hypothetical protein